MNTGMGMGGLDLNFGTTNQYTNVNNNNMQKKQEQNDFDLIWNMIIAIDS